LSTTAIRKNRNCGRKRLAAHRCLLETHNGGVVVAVAVAVNGNGAVAVAVAVNGNGNGTVASEGWIIVLLLLLLLLLWNGLDWNSYYLEFFFWFDLICFVKFVVVVVVVVSCRIAIKRMMSCLQFAPNLLQYW
jgi:hypothetical protein